MIDEDAHQVVTDRPVYQHRRRCGVHAARETADRLRIPDLLPYLFDGVGDDVDRRPVGAATAGLKEKILEDLHPILSVPDLWVKLHPETALVEPRLLKGDDRDVGRLGRHGEALRDGEDGIAVAGPGPLLVGSTREERTVLLDQEIRAAVLPYLDG